MHLPASERGKILAVLFAFVAFLLASNPWLGWDGGIERVTAHDVHIYERMAVSAPAVGDESIAMQQRPRFAGPFAAGVLAKATGIDLHVCFAVIAAVLLALTLVVFEATLRDLRIDPAKHVACLALFVLSPYAFRYYLLAPGLLPDLVFLLGLALTLRGLFGGSVAFTLAGCLLAAAGRQTVLVMLPGVAAGVLWGNAWRRRPLIHRAAFAAASFAGVLTLYKILTTLSGSAPRAGGGGNAGWLLGYAFSLIPWLRSDEFRAGLLVEHVTKTFIPLALPAATAFALAFRERARPLLNGDVLACALLVAGIAFFPLLTSPLNAAGGQTRYTTYALMPALSLMALAIPEPLFRSWRNRRLGIFALLAALGSLHHLNSVVGPTTAVQFTALHLAVAAAVGILVFRAT